MDNLATIYLRLVGSRIRSQLQYRTSFVMYVLGAFALSFTDFLAVLVIFRQLPRLGGWSLGEVAFLYGTSFISFKFTDMLVGHLDNLAEQIRTGEFDLVLIRPLGTLFQVVSSDFHLRHLGGIAQGLIIFAVSLRLIEVPWTPVRLFMLIVMLVCGAAIFAAVWIVGATSTFWVVRAQEYVNAFTYGGNQLTSYPLTIYSGWLRRLFAFVVPLAFVNYYPSLYILDKPDPLGGPGGLRFIAPLVGAVALAFAGVVWGIGVRRYRSTGT